MTHKLILSFRYKEVYSLMLKVKYRSTINRVNANEDNHIKQIEPNTKTNVTYSFSFVGPSLYRNIKLYI